MKNTLLFFMSFLFTQIVFSQKDSLYLGWGQTYDGMSKSKMFLNHGLPYYGNRERIAFQYKVVMAQPINDGVLLVPFALKNTKKIFYSIFCRIWSWEYVGTVSYFPIVIKFSNMGNITLECNGELKTFQRVLFVSSPGLIRWQEIFSENPPKL